MRKHRTALALTMSLSITSWGLDLDMRSSELTYAYSGSLGGTALSGDIVCRPTNDTVIKGLSVVKYLFVKQKADSIDTSYDYLRITDTSVVNYAWVGNTPFVLLKRANANDSLRLEESPYTTLAFPFSLNASWVTRPESTGLQSVKQYVAQESLSVPAGVFYCNRIHTRILVAFQLPDLYSDQWSLGTTIIKTYIDYGENAVTDSLGNPIATYHDWELFELKSHRTIEPMSSVGPGSVSCRNEVWGPGANRDLCFTVQGRRVNAALLTRGILISTGRARVKPR